MDDVLRSALDCFSGTENYQPPEDDDMHFPQTSEFRYRTIQATDIEQLSTSEVGRHRRYLQVQPGLLKGQLTEIKLDGVILVREQLNASLHIEAGPPAHFVPLGTLLGPQNNMRFCGREFQENALLQATGGEWDLYCHENIDYAACIIDKSVLARFTKQLTAHDTDPEWFVSRSKPINPAVLNPHKQWMSQIFRKVKQSPELLDNTKVRRRLSADVIHQAVTLLMSTSKNYQPLSPPTRRQKGVRRVVEYLTAYARELPSIPELCSVAQLSERSLEYGFREQFGVTPVRYLNLVRLNGAHRDLYHGHAAMKVADVAMHWGFFELGRFSGVYARLFNELPSQTLRRVNH